MRTLNGRSMLLFGLAFALVLPAISLSAAPLCSVVCTEASLCSQWCRDSGERITCGDYGVCNSGGGGGCVANYQVVSSTVTWVFPVDYPIPGYCEEIAAYRLTYHDLNGCVGSADYYGCAYSTIHTHSSTTCCLDVSCGGSGACGPY